MLSGGTSMSWRRWVQWRMGRRRPMRREGRREGRRWMIASCYVGGRSEVGGGGLEAVLVGDLEIVDCTRNESEVKQKGRFVLLCLASSWSLCASDGEWSMRAAAPLEQSTTNYCYSLIALIQFFDLPALIDACHRCLRQGWTFYNSNFCENLSRASLSL